MPTTDEPATAQPVAKDAPRKHPASVLKAERAAAARLHKEELHARKLHAIATRRAKEVKLDKAKFIAEIVKGNYPPITAADIAAEPTPE